jgi:MFS family permease
MTGSRMGAMVASALFLIAAACSTVVTFLPSEDWTVLILGLAFLAVGCGEACGVVARTTILGACVRPSIRGRAAATLGGFLRAGFTLGPLLAGIVAEYAMSRSVYLLMGSFALLAILISWVCIPTFNPNQSIELKVKKSKDTKDVDVASMTTLDVVRKHWRILCISSLFCSFLILVRRSRELFFALEGQRLELSHSQIGAITAVSFAVDGVLFPVAGWMLDRVGRVRTAALSMLGLGASMLILHGDTFAFYVVFAVVSGLSNSISAGIVQLLSADLAPAECRSQFIGIFRTLAKCADIAAPAMIGAVAEVTSLKTAGMIVAGASMAGAVFGISFMRETVSLTRHSKAAAEGLHPHATGKPAKIGKKDGEDLARGVELSAEAPVNHI